MRHWVILAAALTIAGCGRSAGVDVEIIKAGQRAEPVIHCAPEATAAAAKASPSMIACAAPLTGERRS